MKRLPIVLALMLAMSLPMTAERVTPETARKVASTFLTSNGAKSAQLTDLTKEAGFPNLYIFTTENSFVVMAADDCAQPILGYSFENAFVADDMPENMRWWLQQYSDEIQWGIENGIRSDKSTADEWKKLQEGKGSKDTPAVIVGPLIATRWGQDAPYNNLCPNNESAGKRAVTGCVATAMAQVMKYWNYPEQGVGSNTYTPADHPEYGEQSANFGETTYDWDNMTNTYNNTSTDTQKQAVATLMYHCGVSVNMDYDYSQADTDHVGSGASTAMVPESLKTYFKYAPSATYKYKDDFTNDQWIALLQHELDESRPVLYAGRYVTSTGGGGHAFVCDGYRSDGKFHFNWGWEGNKDSYFAIGALNPGGGNTGSGQGTYNVNNAAAFFVEPISSLEAPTVSVTASGSSLVLSWDAIAEADAYDIYRDNVKIETGFTQNSYTDTDIASGSYYEYYVRAVNGETRSNLSNIVIGMAVFRDIPPTNLSAAMDGENITLSWTGCEENPSVELHYAVSTNGYAWAADETTPGTYWGQRYPSSMLANLVGMEISKVSCCFYFASNYTMYIFNGDPTETDKLYERSYTKTTNGQEWYDFTFSTPLQFDCSKDLWIVFYNKDSKVKYPALVGEYNGMGASDAKYIATTLEDLPTNTIEEEYPYSFLIRACFSEGTHTYNIYDNGVSVANEIATTSFTHENPADNTTHRYTVKTHWYGGESAASNMAGIAIGTTALESLTVGANEKMTVAPNSTLTVTGALSNDNPDNLILENGAQLLHDSEGVKATVNKTIEAYTADDNGWCFIASPVTENITPSVENGLIANEYDLYYYDEPKHYWRNHVSHSDDFTIEHKKGYLYANNTETTLQFEGTLAPSNAAVSITGLSHSAETLNGFNLVGNPFACHATVDQDCYVISGNQVILANNAPTLAPCEGVMVKATSDQFAVTFTKASGAKGNGKDKSLDLVVTQGKTTLDRARVRLGEGTNMEKFNLDNEHTQISFWNNGQDFAVAYTDGQDEMPLNFKAAKNGTYTLAFEVENLDLDYLHLIDNMTGDEVDVLAMPNYTFEAKTSDYASRFRLVFAENDTDGASTGSAAFAYIADGEILINEADASDASLQVVDMTGHVVVSVGGHTRCVPTTGIPAGVYVLRLINGDTVRTQKIVIE
ncbi:MAG: C10 family peptidase [Bacteroidales bacterium]|nr:C10 family peptidase [Bacteroidales bacterium]